MAILSLLLVMQYLPLVSAISGSDTPAYSYEYEGTGGLLGDKWADAIASTGVCKTYAYIYATNCIAYAGVYAHYVSSGSYRWSVEADVDLTAYTQNVGLWSQSWVIIYIDLLDSNYNRITAEIVWSEITYNDQNVDLSFEQPITVSHAFSTYYNNVRYFGVRLYISAFSGATICQDAYHTSSSYPAYLQVSQIRWSSY